MNIYSILQEFNNTNSTNDKLEVMKKYKDNAILKEVFLKALDKVKWTYGITLKNIPSYTSKDNKGLEYALSQIELLANRTYSGNAAIAHLLYILESISTEDAYVIERIIERDLKINFGKTGYNKIVDSSSQCTRPPYMRCDIYNDKTAKKIKFPAILQLKADGMFVAVTVDTGAVSFISRSGEEREFEHLRAEFAVLPDGVYIGEMLVRGMTNRSDSNGVINSDGDKTPVYVQLWDYISLDEYSRGKDKANKTPYIKRWTTLNQIINEESLNLRIIPTTYPSNIQEALQQTSIWMKEGYEGSILKDLTNIFCDHTSPTQLKLKLEIAIDVRITGFTAGTKGTKRENFFGAITFETDDGKIKGQTSGFTDNQLEEFNSKREELTGKVMTVECNDITKGRDNEYYALSHPRFIEIREKNETDTLERALKQRDSAMQLSTI